MGTKNHADTSLLAKVADIAALVDQIFDVMVRDFSKFAVELYGKQSSTPKQMEYSIKMIKKPAADKWRY